MNLYKIIILSVICISISMSQFKEVSINIDYSNINENQMFIFENFEYEIKSYFINNYFFDDPDQLELYLNIHMIIENILDKGGEKLISAQIMFSNGIEQHLFSKSFDFTYNKGEALYKSEIFHPLSSLLTCFAYLQIAYELDTYEYLGGNTYFIKAQDIAANGKNSMYSKNWQIRLKKIRRQTENITYRTLRYNFFTTYDFLNTEEPNLEQATQFYIDFYNSLLEYEEYYGYSKPLIQFLAAYATDIVKLAKIVQLIDVIDFLLIYDKANATIYQQYYINTIICTMYK